MLYNIHNYRLTINDLIGNTKYKFNLKKFNFHKGFSINHVVSDYERKAVALSFKVVDMQGYKIVKTYQEGVLLCNLKTSEIDIIYDKTCHDMIFDKTDSRKLFINTNGIIASVCMTDRAVNRIYKFRNFTEAPIDMKQSEDGKLLLFSKYKSDNKMLHLINLESNTLDNIIGSTFNYDFLSNNEVIHSLSGGLKVYNTVSRKNTIPLTNAIKIAEQYGDSANIDQVREAFNIKKGDRIIINEVYCPKVFCERVYFKVRITSKRKDFCKWCSVDKNFKDFQIHFENPERYGRGELFIYGDSSKYIFVVNAGRMSGCHVYDGDKSYTIKKYEPIDFS